MIMDSKKDTRYWILFIIVLVVSIFLIVKLNNMSKQQCTDDSTEEKSFSRPPKKSSALPPSERNITQEFYENGGLITTVTNVAGEPNQSRFQYEYRLWPEGSFQEPDNYGFYSMYGWRTNPPYQFPQKTIGTAYDEAIRKCICEPLEDNQDCLQRCRFSALKNSGFPSIFKK